MAVLDARSSDRGPGKGGPSHIGFTRRRSSPDGIAPLAGSRATQLRFGAPVYILQNPLSRGVELEAVVDVDGAMAFLQATRVQALCFGEDGSERCEWTVA